MGTLCICRLQFSNLALEYLSKYAFVPEEHLVIITTNYSTSVAVLSMEIPMMHCRSVINDACTWTRLDVLQIVRSLGTRRMRRNRNHSRFSA